MKKLFKYIDDLKENKEAFSQVQESGDNLGFVLKENNEIQINIKKEEDSLIVKVSLSWKKPNGEYKLIEGQNEQQIDEILDLQEIFLDISKNNTSMFIETMESKPVISKITEKTPKGYKTTKIVKINDKKALELEWTDNVTINIRLVGLTEEGDIIRQVDQDGRETKPNKVLANDKNISIHIQHLIKEDFIPVKGVELSNYNLK